jgi:CRISPR-associated protein Cas1
VATLFITEQQSFIRKTGDRLIVEKDGEVLLEIPCLKIETVLIYGNVQVTSQALAEMLDQGIELALLSRSGRLRGQLTPPKAKNMPLRMRQYELSGSEDFCLGLARSLVAAKIASSAAVLWRFQKNHPDSMPDSEIAEVERAAEGLEAVSTLDSLRGLEGTAAARYFRCFARMAPAGIGFEDRNRRPPRDPLNALLSFGYVLVGAEIQALLDAMGFDPYLGFFHQIEYGRPSLALDLLEEFRAPLVDRFSLRLLNLGILDRASFTATPEGGVILEREALKRYFAAYEKELTKPVAVEGEAASFRELFRRQAERLARALTQGETYEPFRLPC